MRTEDFKIIDSIDEIIDCDTRYAHSSKPNKYISIDMDYDGTFSIYGMVCGDHATAITREGNWNYVKEWKTFNGAKKALKLYAEKSEWGMSHWINK